MREDCEICGADNVLPMDETGPGLDIVACCECGLVWNRAMGDAAAQEHFYRDENRAHNALSRDKLASRLGRAACVLDFLNGDLTPGMRHLDVGCAEGTLLALTRAQGLEVTGLELDRNWSSYARSARQLEVIPALLEDSRLPPAGFDLISFVHVTEHLTQPVRTLQRASELLDDQGYLYVEVPNLEQPLPRLRRFFRPLHNFYFTANTLRALVTKAGFRPVRIGYSRRDSAVQLLAVKVAPIPEGDVALPPSIWRDDAGAIRRRIQHDRDRHYLMLPLLVRWLRQQQIKRKAVQRFGRCLPEFRRGVTGPLVNAAGMCVAWLCCQSDAPGVLAELINAAT